jgi:hypothetical protein
MCHPFLTDTPSSSLITLLQVAAWRVRGRIPLGIDATASLWETCIQDTSQIQPSSELTLRLQYSMSIIRLVNGIADSSQRGKVAASIASLASAAGLPRVLVDLRHQATHNELPSLAVLRTGAGMALQWLMESYWKQQSECIAIGQSKINDTLRAYIQLHIKAAQIAHTNQMSIDDDDEDDTDDCDKEEVDRDGNSNNNSKLNGGKSSPFFEYNAAEAKRQRKALLTELKATVPPASMHLLLPGLLDAYTTDNASNSSSIETALTTLLDHLSTHWPSLCPVLFKTATSQLCQMSTIEVINSDNDKSNKVQAPIEALIKWIQRFIHKAQRVEEKGPSNNNSSNKGWIPSQAQLLHIAHSMMKTLIIIKCSVNSNSNNPLLLRESLVMCMADIVVCLDKDHPGSQRLLVRWNRLCIDNINDDDNGDTLIVGDAVVEQAKQNLEKVLKGRAAGSSNSLVGGGEKGKRKRWSRVDHHHQPEECAIGMVASLFDDNGEVPLLDCDVGDVKVRVRRKREGGRWGVLKEREARYIQENPERSGGSDDDISDDDNADTDGVEERPQKHRRLTVDELRE